jgi:hypothetical protein
MSREVAKHTFFPFIKYSKNKDTKKIDLTKPPSIRAKVPFYDGKWAVEIYDTKQNMLFPCGNENLTPLDFVPKQSNVACVLQCGGIWIGGKGWGLTWKLIQCIVKPREVVSVYGKCQIKLTDEDRDTIETQEIDEEVEEDAVVESTSSAVVAPTSTQVDDSDEEQEEEEEVEVATPVPVAPEPVVKKVVKKAPAPIDTSVEVESAPVPEPVKKKVIKKKV